ncbi:dephospho-CoA kinase [Rhizobium sp. CRIBSB]|nr:dephospho-CoA kinase [Rhizobium sp. CRIBSB]
MIVIGLTGSIGMGKSTTSGLFAEQGIPVNDADQLVHDLYRGQAVAPIQAVFPEVIVKGVVDRQRLSENLAKNPANFKRLESIVHPLVRACEADFLARHHKRGEPIVVLDIPLLFETGAEARVDKVVVVSCAEQVQRQRVMARPGMTKEKLDLILSRQVPDADKRARADYVIDTGQGIDMAREQVKTILEELRAKLARGDHA